MARGTQFLTLQTRLRSELRRSQDVAVGVNDLYSLKETLNHQYDLLYVQRDWPFLRRIFSIPLQDGERYYDPPDGLNVERIESAAVDFGGLPQPVERGIDFEHYATFDSDAGEESEPMLRWDVRVIDDEAQIEVWPIPSTNTQTLFFKGIQSVARMVDDDDVCLLDDTLVVLFAAAELAASANLPDAKVKLQMAQAHFDKITARQRGGSGGYRLGLGVQGASPGNGVTLRVR